MKDDCVTEPPEEMLTATMIILVFVYVYVLHALLIHVIDNDCIITPHLQLLLAMSSFCISHLSSTSVSYCKPLFSNIA